MATKIYLDYNATTPLETEVENEIIKAMKEAWGNPSSSSEPGVKAKKCIDEARTNIALMLGANPTDIVFTSGGTEGNNWILRMALEYYQQHKNLEKKCGTGSCCHKDILPHFVTSNIEHDSVKCVLEHFEKAGLAEVSYVSVSSKTGAVEIGDLMSALRPNTVMVTIMLANNESGVIQPIAQISKELKKRPEHSDPSGRILLHTDAAQCLGKMSVDVKDLDVDFLTVVGHKFYGPRIGAVYICGLNTDTPVYPMLFGGGQERSFRPGTENTPMIAGLGKAAELVHLNIDKYNEDMKDVRDYLEEQLLTTFGDKIIINFRKSPRLVNTCSVSFKEKGLEGHRLLSAARHLQASVGAACHAQNRPSRILLSMGVSEELARNTLRLSVGWHTSKKDIDVIISDLKEAAQSLLK
jgi:selenocysteine lyase